MLEVLGLNNDDSSTKLKPADSKQQWTPGHAGIQMCGCRLMTGGSQSGSASIIAMMKPPI